jgi:hypothetical protein
MVPWKMFEGYPRLQEVFGLNRVYDAREQRQREDLVREIEGQIEEVYRKLWEQRLFRFT